MKKTRAGIAIGMVLFGCGAVYAMLPPDASVREPQLRRERVAANKKYEKYITEQRAIAVQHHWDVKDGLDFPPWKVTATGAPKPGATLSKRTRSVEETIGHSWRIGLIGLLLVGALFWFIKQMTREADNR